MRSGQSGASRHKARGKPHASGLLGGCPGVVFVFSSYSLRISLVFSWYSPLVSPWGLGRDGGGDTEAVGGFDSTAPGAIQMKARFSMKALAPAVPGPGEILLPFLHGAFGILTSGFPGRANS